MKARKKNGINIKLAATVIKEDLDADIMGFNIKRSNVKIIKKVKEIEGFLTQNQATIKKETKSIGTSTPPVGYFTKGSPRINMPNNFLDKLNKTMMANPFIIIMKTILI